VREKIVSEPWVGEKPHRLTDVAVLPDGRIYVADSANTRVIVFDRDGEPVNRWGE